jgi:hypothetical protein
MHAHKNRSSVPQRVTRLHHSHKILPNNTVNGKRAINVVHTLHVLGKHTLPKH